MPRYSHSPLDDQLTQALFVFVEMDTISSPFLPGQALLNNLFQHSK